MNKGPSRADQVGSLLRSQALHEARIRRAKGELNAQDFRAIEDHEVLAVIRKQEDVGLKVVTDGEYRRAVWSLDFLEKLRGVEVVAGPGADFKNVQAIPKVTKVTGKVGFVSQHPFLEDFRFVKYHTKVRAKFTIPSPSVLHFRIGDGVSRSVYPTDDALFVDLGETYKKTVEAFYNAGCRYLQLDDTVWAYLCSAAEREKARARGLDPDKLPAMYAKAINHAIKGRPADMTVTTHVCRGNFRSSWISEGGYEPVAEFLFNELDYDGFFLEYDSDRAGGFEPLRFLPKGNKKVVLGLVTSKTGTLESKDAIKRRIDEASKFAPLDQLCLSPQCGFASSEEGNILTEEQQWAKLRMIVEIATEVWGSA